MRIQILPLPSVVVGEMVEEPFALVIDQWDDTPLKAQAYAEQWDAFKTACGARAILATAETVEVVDRFAESATDTADSNGPVGPAGAALTVALLGSFGKTIGKVRDLRDTQGQQGTWNYDEYMRGMFNGLELALSILESERPPQYRSVPVDGYLCDRPTPDMSGPEYAPVPAEG